MNTKPLSCVRKRRWVMVDYRTGSHTIYNIKYYFVWITKFRYHILQRKDRRKTPRTYLSRLWSLRDRLRQRECESWSCPSPGLLSTLWARGYFCGMVGTVTDEMIKPICWTPLGTRQGFLQGQWMSFTHDGEVAFSPFSFNWPQPK